MVKCRMGNRNTGSRSSLGSDGDWRVHLVSLKAVQNFSFRERQDDLMLQSGDNTENNM